MCDLEGMKPVTQPDGRVTIKDIADRLGISKATVSRALLKRARVAPETRNKVIRTAEEMGYRPDPTLRALSNLRWTQHASKRISYQIALLNMNLNLKSSAVPKFKWPTSTGTRERANELGLDLETFDVVDSKGLRRFGDILYHRGFDGVIFGVKCPVEDWRFPYDRFPCVAISYDNPSHRVHQVTSDWFSAVSIALREVLARGYKRPGFLHYTRGNPAIDQRTWAGMLAARDRIIREFGSAPEIFEYKSEAEVGDQFYNANLERFQNWRQREQPDVIIDAAFLGHWWLRDTGIKCPEEVGSVRLCRHHEDHHNEVSAVDHNLIQQGRWAVDILYSMIQTGAHGLPEKPVRITVGCEFFEGTSLKSDPRG
jgi:DNA-binding LacI/PurR family transcriptional regulator